MGGLKPGKRKNALIQTIAVTGKVQHRISSPSLRRNAFRAAPCVATFSQAGVGHRWLLPALVSETSRSAIQQSIADRLRSGRGTSRLPRGPTAGSVSSRAVPPRRAILDAALGLIAEYGVGGTSLQMIADAIGVTKVAVYHQFKTKELIVVALTERELGGLEETLEAAQADPLRARELLLDRVIDLAIERRGAASTLQLIPSSPTAG